MENHFNCIYLYTNKVNDKKYVGQAVDFIKRHKRHFNNAHNPKSNEYDTHFHRSIRKRTNHDLKKFEEIYSVEILKENLTLEELDYWEKYYIAELDLLAKNGKGYNVASGGEGGNTLAGKSDEELAERSRKLSEATKEVWKNRTDEEKAEISRKNSETLRNKSDEEKAEQVRKWHETWHETLRNKSDEEKAEQVRKWHETLRNKSDEEIKEIRKKQSEAMKGEKNPSARKVISVDPITRLPVFTFKYKKQAIDFYGINRETLNYYLKGKAKKGHEYNGFLWYYLDEWQQLNK